MAGTQTCTEFPRLQGRRASLGLAQQLFRQGSGREQRIEVGGQESGGRGKGRRRNQSLRPEAGVASGPATPPSPNPDATHTCRSRFGDPYATGAAQHSSG